MLWAYCEKVSDGGEKLRRTFNFSLILELTERDIDASAGACTMGSFRHRVFEVFLHLTTHHDEAVVGHTQGHGFKLKDL